MKNLHKESLKMLYSYFELAPQNARCFESQFSEIYN